MQIIRTSAILVIAAASVEPLFAAAINLDDGFTSSDDWWAKVIATIHATDEADLGVVGARVDAQVWITESGTQRDSAHRVCGLVAGADVSCPTPLAMDTTVTDGIEYCSDGKADYYGEQGYFDTLNANGRCTTLTGFPPGRPIDNATFIRCHEPGCALWQFTFHADRATRYRLQRKPASGFVWTTVEVVGGTSYTAHLGGNDLDWRVRGENAVGPGPWAYFSTVGRCNTGDGDPGGPGDID